MTSVNILGITIEKRKPHEVIQPEDFNKKKKILLKIIEKLEDISEPVNSDINMKIDEIKLDILALPTVSYGDAVFASHHNDIVNILVKIANILSELYGDILAVLEIKEEVKKLPTVGFGDIVLARHHNSIVNILKKIADLLEDLIELSSEVVLWDDVEVKLYYPPSEEGK